MTAKLTQLILTIDFVLCRTIFNLPSLKSNFINSMHIIYKSPSQIIMSGVKKYSLEIGIK